jgi:hypothetical protein
LFSHPVNQEREASGLPTCNSLWFWGGGRLPGQSASRVATVYASAPLLKGLGRLGKVDCLEIPANFPALGVLDAAWMVLDESQLMDESWFQAAAELLKCGQVETLQFYVAVDGKVLKSSLRRRDLWKFWRKPSAIQSYFEMF